MDYEDKVSEIFIVPLLVSDGLRNNFYSHRTSLKLFLTHLESKTSQFEIVAKA